MKKHVFEIGDEVEWQGVRGVVVKVDNDPELDEPEEAIKVLLYNDKNLVFQAIEFTIDGKYYVWHKKPSLKFIKRGEKNKQYIHCWVNVYKNGNQKAYTTHQDALAHASAYMQKHPKEKIITVHLSKEETIVFDTLPD